MQAKQSWDAIAKSHESFRREITFIETILGHSWGHFEESRAVLGPSWSLLGGSWGLPEGSWGLLGMSWGLLGHSWGLLEWSVGGMLPQLIFLMIFGSILDRSWGPKGSQNGSKMGPKTVQNRRQKSTWKMIAFGTLLDPSWARLEPFWGRSWGQKSLIFLGFIKVPRKFCFRRRNGFEVHLG